MVEENKNSGFLDGIKGFMIGLGLVVGTFVGLLGVYKLNASIHEKDVSDMPAITRSIDNETNLTNYSLKKKVQTLYEELGIAQNRLGEFKEAVDSLEEALKLAPNNAYTLHSLGNAHFGLGNFNKAVEYLEKSVELKSNFELTWYDLSIAQFKADNFDKAVNAYNKILEINPEFKPFFKYKLDKDSVINFHKILVNKISNYDLLSCLAMNLKERDKEGDSVEAAEFFEKAIKTGKANKFDFYQLGFIYGNLKEYKKAIKPLKKVTELEPADDYNWYRLGVAHFELGEFEKAVPYFKKALEINPNAYSYESALSKTKEKLNKKE